MDNCQVTAIHPGGNITTLDTSKGSYQARRVVITAGLLMQSMHT